MLIAIIENPSVTGGELAKKSGLSEAGVRYNINRLKRDGVLKRISPDRGSHWEVLE
jgi:ATP-dependent DNA helicase RecG